MNLGIDIGPQSVKALMYDAEQGRVADVHSALPHDYLRHVEVVSPLFSQQAVKPH